MKFLIDKADFIEEGIEARIKEVINKEIEKFNENITYNLKIDFFNYDLELEEILVVQNMVEGFQIKKEYYVQARKLRETLEDIGVEINNIQLYGTGEIANKNRIYLTLEENKNKTNEKRTKLIPNKELFLVRESEIHMESLTQNGIISLRMNSDFMPEIEYEFEDEFEDDFQNEFENEFEDEFEMYYLDFRSEKFVI